MSSSWPSCCVRVVFPEGALLASRGSVILLFALMRGERWGSPAQAGIRGWGRHLRSDPGTAVKPTFALTHPIEPARDSGTHRVVFDRSDREGGGVHRQWASAWREDRAIAEQRIEDPGQAAGEGDDRDVLPAAGRNAEGPGPERLGLGGPAPENRDGRLDEQPARAAGAGLGDGTAALRVARAVLARHEAEIGLELVRVGEALDVVDRGDKGGGGHGPDARDGAQTLDALIVSGHTLDRLVGIRELAVEVTHHREERGDQREQRAREGEGADPRGEGLGPARGDAVSLLAEECPDERDVPGAGADERVADEQAAAHMALGVGEAMRPAVGAEQTGVGQGARVSAIGLHLASPRRIHRGEVRIGDDDLVAQRLQTPRDPFTVGRGLDDDPRSWPIPEDRGEALGLRADPSLDQLASLGQGTNLAFPLVDVDANMVHGWPLLSAALTAGVLLWGRVGHHVKREASRFIPSTLWPRLAGFQRSTEATRSFGSKSIRSIETISSGSPL